MSLLTPGIFVVRNAFLLRIFVVDVVNNYILATNLRVFHKSSNVAETGSRAAVKKTPPLHVGLGPSDATRACERVSLAMLRSRGTGPRATVKNGPLHRRAWALGCQTRIRAGFPRHAALAGDRPPRYGEKNGSLHRRAWALGCQTRIRAGSPRHAALAGDRPPRYGEKQSPSPYIIPQNANENTKNCNFHRNMIE